MSGRNNQVIRIYMILQILEQARNGYSVTQISSKLKERDNSYQDTSTRTIYRDLEALQAAGFPLERKEQKDTESTAQKWTMQKTTSVNQYLVLSPRELVGLYLAKKALTPLSGTPFYRDLEGLFSKIESRLGDSSLEHLKEISSDYHFEPGPIWGLGIDPNVLDTITAACGEGHIVEATYASVNTNSKKKRQLGPHYLYFSKGSVYLVAEDLADHKVKHFALPRMSEACMTMDEYTGTKTDPKEHFKDSFGIYRGETPVDIRVSFAREVASFVKERSWHSSQQVTSKSDGTVELRLHASITPELVQWVMGFGCKVKVLEPVELISTVQKEANAMLGIYKPKSEKKSA